MQVKVQILIYKVKTAIYICKNEYRYDRLQLDTTDKRLKLEI